jgi:uncharacterized protein
VSTMQAPGVYSKVVSSGNKPIESVGSSTAAFIGYLASDKKDEATLITSWQQFQSLYGGITASNLMSHAVYGFFLNGGSKCYVYNIGKNYETEELEVLDLIKGQDKGPGRRTGLFAFADIEDISMVAVPGFTSLDVQQVLADHCAQMQDRVAVLDGPEELKDCGLDDLPRIGSNEDASLYFPWVLVYDEKEKKNIYAPPCGHVMGTIARVDTERGVHKAPANEVLRGALGLRYNLSRVDQTVLNPRGINAIRHLGDMGIRVYGARTLSEDAEWRYLNVRRLFHVVKQSVTKGSEWVVFEPNNEQLWGDIERNIRGYLKTLYLSGALQGTTPEEAFYVRCNSENNPQELIDRGVVNIEIGIAPVKPAEFVSISIQQKIDADNA